VGIKELYNSNIYYIMKFISTKIHGVLDFLMAFLLLSIPFMMHYDIGAMVGRIFIIFGVATVIYSLITRYESGLLSIIPMQLHLVLDILSGIVLAASPWLFGFSDIVFMPHLIIGIVEIIIALTTKSKTSLSL